LLHSAYTLSRANDCRKRHNSFLSMYERILYESSAGRSRIVTKSLCFSSSSFVMRHPWTVLSFPCVPSERFRSCSSLIIELSSIEKRPETCSSFFVTAKLPGAFS
ncbi:hypothetical protein PFISCL1PPCAC_21866, partial [Pristionchus fissidentatus]